VKIVTPAGVQEIEVREVTYPAPGTGASAV